MSSAIPQLSAGTKSQVIGGVLLDRREEVLQGFRRSRGPHTVPLMIGFAIQEVNLVQLDHIYRMLVMGTFKRRLNSSARELTRLSQSEALNH